MPLRPAALSNRKISENVDQNMKVQQLGVDYMVMLPPRYGSQELADRRPDKAGTPCLEQS